MKKIFFVTGNNNKFEQVSRWTNELTSDIKLEQINLEIPEYQSLDINYVAKNKAIEAWKILNKSLIVDDFGIYIENLNQFPGPLAKYIYKGIGLDGFWKLINDGPMGYICSCFVYINEEGNHKIFEGKTLGKFIEPKFKIQNEEFPYSQIFIPDGSNKTLSELKNTPEEQKYNHRFKAVKKWIESIRFCSSHN